MGGILGSKLTPIERAIAGEPADRRRRYEHRLVDRGMARMSIIARTKHARAFRLLAALSRVSADSDERWEAMMGEVMKDLEDAVAGLPDL